MRQLYLNFQDLCVSELNIPSVDVLHSFTSNSVLRAEFCLLLSLTYSHSKALEQCCLWDSPWLSRPWAPFIGVSQLHLTLLHCLAPPRLSMCTTLVSIVIPGFRNLKVLDEDWVNNTLKTIASYFHLMYPFSNCSVIHVCICLLIFFFNIVKYMFSKMPWRGYEFVSVVCDWMPVRKQNMEEVIL